MSAEDLSGEAYEAGLKVRRSVLGDPYVDSMVGDEDPLAREFQRFLTEHAWGAVWTRPGLDRRSRSLITLTALVARGATEELAHHFRGALRNGLTKAELIELLMHCAVYCSFPAALTAFRVARKVFAEEDEAAKPRT